VNGAGAARWIPLSGIVYVVLFVVVLVVIGDSPAASDPDADFVSYYADSGNRNKEFAAFFILVVATMFFLWFVTDLRARLRAVESEPHGLSTLAFGSGLVSAAMLLGAVCVGVGPAVTRVDSDRFTVDPDTVRLTGDTSMLLLVSSTMVAAVLVAATSVLAIRTGVLPAWLGWIGLILALAALVAVFWIPILAYLAWVFVVSVVLIVRPAAPAPAPDVPRPASPAGQPTG
jgi:hypothetical protein